MELLTVKDVAELKCCSVRYIQQLINKGVLEAVVQINQSNNKMQYLIPVSSLPADLQKKYYSKRKSEAGTASEMKPVKTVKKQSLNAVKKAFGDYSAEERKEIFKPL